MGNKFKTTIGNWWRALSGLTLISIYQFATKAHDATDIWEWLNTAMTWVNDRWWAGTILLFAGVALVVWNIERRAAAKYLPRDSLNDAIKGFVRMDSIEAIYLRLGQLEERKAALDSLATADFLERNYPIFQKAVEGLDAAFQEVCEKLQGPIGNEGIAGQGRAVGMIYQMAFKRLKYGVEYLRRELSSDQPTPDRLHPTGSHNFPAEVRDTYIQLWIQHEINKYRIAQVDRSVNATPLLKAAHEVIDRYARSMR